jgi:hypothetical protein
MYVPVSLSHLTTLELLIEISIDFAVTKKPTEIELIVTEATNKSLKPLDTAKAG